MEFHPAEESSFSAGREEEEEQEEEEEAVCRRSAVQGTPLRSSLAATGCGMRRAEKRETPPPALTVKRGLEQRDGPVWKSAHALRQETRK